MMKRSEKVSDSKVLKPKNSMISTKPMANEKMQAKKEDMMKVTMKEQTPMMKITMKEKIAMKTNQPKIQGKGQQNKEKVKPSLSLISQVKQDLFPCKDCGRTFIDTALKHHQKICKKVFLNKRKQFNSAKQRLVSKEQVNLLKNKKNLPQVPTEKKGSQINNEMHNEMPLWKQQSIAFRQAMRQVKGTTKTEEQIKFAQKQTQIIKASMFQCKFCSRHFNDEAGKRHEPFCQKKAKQLAMKKRK